jgi:hypothetical protein
MKKITYSNQFSRLALIAMCFSFSSISSSYATSSTSDVLADRVSSEKSAYSEKVMVDFETVKVDWKAGVGGYAWAGATFSVETNPSVDAKNNSAYSLKWIRDATTGNSGGGYVLQFGTAQNATGWDRISFQIYSSSPLTNITMTFKANSVIQGSKLVVCNVLANQWTTISMNMSDINMVGKSFTDMMVQAGSNSTVQVITTYTDNFKFEKGQPDVVTPPVVTSNAIGDDAFPIANVIDGVNTTDWRGATKPSASNPVWLQVKYSAAQTFKQYTLTSNGDSPANDPMIWVLEGSNDATTWTTLDTRSNYTWESYTGQSAPYSARKTAATFSFSNSNAYLYYRLTTTAINGGTTGIRLAEIAFSSLTTGITSSISEKVRIFSQPGEVVVDLSDMKDASTVTVFDIKGNVVKTMKSPGNETLNICLEHKGIYLIRVQNSTILTQKVIL